MEVSRYRLFVLLALLLEAAFLSLHWLDDFTLRVVEYIAIYLAASLFYLFCCFLIMREERRPSDRRVALLIWTAAVLFRLTVLPLDPKLSEDLNRYRWNGKLAAAGGNPYTEVPQDPRWAHLRDSTYPSVNRKDLPSVYGPVLEHFNAAYYRLVSLLVSDEKQQVWLFKVPFAIFEMGVGLALAALLRQLQLPQTRLLIYLWSPLAVVEFWGQGHNDTLAILFLLPALAAALKNQWTRGWSWLTLAALTKFWPLLLAPFFLLRRERGQWRFHGKNALVSVPIALAVSWPFLEGVSRLESMLNGFIGGWRNNDSLYALIYYYAVEEDFDRGTVWVTRILAAAVIILWTRQGPLIRSTLWAVVALLFLSANCFPWYLSWMLPFLAVYPNSALLLWTSLVSLAYHVLIDYGASGAWQYSNDFLLLEYVPVFGLLAGLGVWSAVRSWKGTRFGGQEFGRGVS